jgi:hypothetical protein
LLTFMFVVEPAGRSLGLDALLRRKVADVREGKGLVGGFFHMAG